MSASAVEQEEPREVMEYDVCIVGAGPAGLAAAIRIKQVGPSFACPTASDGDIATLARLLACWGR